MTLWPQNNASVSDTGMYQCFVQNDISTVATGILGLRLGEPGGWSFIYFHGEVSIYSYSLCPCVFIRTYAQLPRQSLQSRISMHDYTLNEYVYLWSLLSPCIELDAYFINDTPFFDGSSLRIEYTAVGVRPNSNTLFRCTLRHRSLGIIRRVLCECS